MPFPQKFKLIFTDNPWQYKDKALAGNRGASCKYPVMTIEELKELPIKQITDDDCVLLSWGTWPLLQENLDVIKAWGFEYKTCCFVWIKRYATGKLFKGMGSVATRSNTEYCLLGTKGNPKRISSNVQQVFEQIEEGSWTAEAITADIQEHSVKPDVFRQRAVKLFGDITRIELFARKMVTGWYSIGNDIDGMDIRECLNQIIAGKYEQKQTITLLDNFSHV